MSDFSYGDRVAFSQEPFHWDQDGKNYEGITPNWRNITARIISSYDKFGDYVVEAKDGIDTVEIWVSADCLVLIEKAFDQTKTVWHNEVEYGNFSYDGMILVYVDKMGKRHFQSWHELKDMGVLIDPDTGYDMPVEGWMQEL